MSEMRNIVIASLIGLSLPIMSAGSAHAQVLAPPPSMQPVIPFPTAPPPPPPPKIEVPKVPQMNSPPPFELGNTRPGMVTQGTPPEPVLKPSRRRSYGDRMTRCLQEGAAMGYGPNERAAYARMCANQ